MQERHLYDYALIRAVPNIEREEFVNVGLIMFCKRPCYLRIRTRVNEEKLLLFHPQFDMESLYANLGAFEKVCSGHEHGGPISRLEVPERFRWLTAVRSASIQTSRPHAGFADDLDATFDRLFDELVL